MQLINKSNWNLKSVVFDITREILVLRTRANINFFIIKRYYEIAMYSIRENIKGFSRHS